MLPLSVLILGLITLASVVAASWRMIRAEWPRRAPHVLTPLVLYVLPGTDFWLLVLPEIVGPAARGLTTSYYVRATEPAGVESEYAIGDPALYG